MQKSLKPGFVVVGCGGFCVFGRGGGLGVGGVGSNLYYLIYRPIETKYISRDIHK